MADSLRSVTDPAVDGGLTTVLFDFDGTLVFHEPDSFDVISAFCADIGQPLSPEAAWHGRRTRHEYFVDPIIREQLNDFSAGQFWQHFNHYLLQAMDIQGDLDSLAEELTARFDHIELVYHCPEPGCHTLTELHQRGYQLGLITNRSNVERFYKLLAEVGLPPCFDLTMASGEVGIQKPQPGIFFAALERIGTQPEQALYVGDNYWADVVGARRAGVTPVLIDPYRLFPEADCLILDRIEDLLTWLP
jgi:HAD superfamily hydrolase (TIGR01549 family)